MNVHMGQPLQKQATVVDAFRTEEISRPEAQANGGHIDSRLTKSVPSKADVGNVSETNDATAIAQPADDSIIRLSLSSAGKAIPIKNGSKTNGKYKVDVSIRRSIFRSRNLILTLLFFFQHFTVF